MEDDEDGIGDEIAMIMLMTMMMYDVLSVEGGV